MTFVHSESDVDYVGDIQKWDNQKRARHTIKNLFTKHHDHENHPLPSPIIPEDQKLEEEKVLGQQPEMKFESYTEKDHDPDHCSLDHCMIYTRLMCNYFSIGIESRIGLGFDKHRSSSAFANNMWYTWEGLKKMCCCSSTKKIRDVVDRVTCMEENGQEELIFTTHP